MPYATWQQLYQSEAQAVWSLWVVPALFLALSVFLSVSIVIERPVRSLIGIGLILAGIPFYLFWNRRRPGG